MSAVKPATRQRPVSPWLERFAPLIRPGGHVLDVACGSGRHLRWLSARGFAVTGVDIDTTGLADIGSQPRVRVITHDLERDPWPLPGETFDAVLCVNYLCRRLFKPVAASLSDGGILIYDTFAAGQERIGRPRRPDFLLQPGELLDAFAGLDVVAYEYGLVSEPVTAVRQRICAVSGGSAPRAVRPEAPDPA